MASTTTKAPALSVIVPGDEAFDTNIGRKGRPDVVTPAMNELLSGVLADGLTEFQLPAGAEFQGHDGKTHKLTVGKVRTWAHEKGKLDSSGLLPEGASVEVGGGENGANIRVKIKGLPTEG